MFYTHTHQKERDRMNYFINGFLFIAQPREEVVVTMPDGSERKAKSWETSPLDVAKEISKSLSERIVIAKVQKSFLRLKRFSIQLLFYFIQKVDGELWDLERPLEKSCKLELLDFEHPEGKARLFFLFMEVGRKRPTFIYIGKKVFWHSSAHVLGEAAERHYGCHLCLGPPTDDGFFYEMAIEER